MKHFITPLVIVLFSIIMNGCSKDETFPGQYPGLHGIWERVGYGDVLVINKDTSELYQYTRQTCLHEETMDNDELEELLVDELHISDDQQAFSVVPPATAAFTVHFKRLQALPAVCQPDQIFRTGTPTQTFEHFWHNFNDYYAFFKERRIDWQQQYTTYRPRISDNMSQTALWKILKTMLAPIDDGHINLYSNTDEYSPEQPSRLDTELEQAFKQQTETIDYSDFTRQQLTRIKQIQNHYISGLKQGGGPEEGVASWGRIDKQLGYLCITRLDGINPYIDKKHIDDTTGSEDVAATKTLMERVISDLQGISALIIDVRLNYGGYDAVSLEIANHFVREQQLAVEKHSLTWQGTSQTVQAHLQPAKQGLQVPIIVLSSGESASAAEIFLMAMRTIPEVTLMGENSLGTLSDTLYKLLPNGWEMTLSNEVYYDHAGHKHEVSGIPVDVEVNPFDLTGFSLGRDTTLDQAIKYLGFEPPEL